MLKSVAMIAAAALAAITVAAPAKAWDVAPANYVAAAVSAPVVTFDWPQWRLQNECGPEAHEATEGRTILACTWQAAGLCFIAVWNGLRDAEAAELLRLHERPHCVGWDWDHPGGTPWHADNQVAAR
ncbi:MAG: hypothetical protein IT534_06820 [Bauldia sp.]|nr:hypothetical protein [Bauldia sp.]